MKTSPAPKCDRLPEIENGDVRGFSRYYYPSTQRLNSRIPYSCKGGYLTDRKMEHGDTRCTENGWSPKPKCTRFCLFFRAFVRNGRLRRFERDYLSGEKVDFTCNAGYLTPEGKSHGEMECLPDGGFTEAKCSPSVCPPPPGIDNGYHVAKLKAEYVHLDNMQYACNQGYNLEKGINQTVCRETQWKSIPVCRKAGARCSKPPAVQFGDFLGPNQQNYTSGFNLEYKCPEYYILVGNQRVTCKDGVWDEPPICLEPCTAKEKDMKEYNIRFKWTDANKLYSKHDEQFLFDCVEGFEITDSSLLRVKCNKGVIPYPKCNRIGSCLLLEETMKKQNIYLDRSSAIQDGEKVTFACIKGMIPENTLEGTCKMRVLNYPRCITATSCRLDQNQINIRNLELDLARNSEGYYGDGEDVHFVCKEGFRSVTGSVVGTCENTDLTYPTCIPERSCVLDHSALESKKLQQTPKYYYEDGESVTFICKPGFNALNQMTRKCEKKRLTYPRCG
uniref:Sushi domain-containing protein n=1 Tax=Leptobrachium leishanense TaxID=445787 RepID=A0A8C5R8F2_9ANUR